MDDTPAILSLDPTVTKLNRRVVESTEEVGSPQSARNKTGSLKRRPPCPSMCLLLSERRRKSERNSSCRLPRNATEFFGVHVVAEGAAAFRAAVMGLTTVETRPRARFVFGLGMLAIVFLDPSGEHRHTQVCCVVRSTQCLSKSHSNVTTKAFHSMDEHQSLVPQIKSFQMTASISWLHRRPVRRPSLLLMSTILSSNHH